MKSSIVRTLVTLGLGAVLSPIALLAQGSINATIPFDFTVSGKSLAAGDYSIRQLSQDILLIRSVKGNSAVMTVGMAGEKTGEAGTGLLTFNRYGDTYFLSKVSSDSRGWELPRSPVEKELIARFERLKPVVVAAGLRSK
jgi:hypothetical protein